MNFLQAIILGIIQGIGEPIPISSSAQTIIASFLMNIETPGILFEVFLNFASFLAILWLTRNRVYKIITGSVMYITTKDKKFLSDFKMALYVIIGTLPAVVFGFTMKGIIENYLNNITTIGIFLIITGCLLFFVRKLNGYKNEFTMTWKDALIIGLVQGTLSLIPGISRSGSTIVAALLIGLTRETAFYYSFLLYLPVGLGTMILGYKDLVNSPLFRQNVPEYALMFVVTFFATIIGFNIFKSVMERGKLIYFSIYCWLVGSTLLIWF
ncbi:Undecaprenyl-diphosphatase [Alkalithermobacter thermoalcaliphilus JW-YL-7 = DSM 7308]|uniref:Undecaprenyl-diphosphatase n=1 Tax=Alkalithermobacter thermoalcaliphilus JW-YL-7 = DSM 7308 TaxID=1121328 RepID=A0A150FP70_CLOPD|nr:Undecaprenyl-diphosphatase [[Clostridium] paradoxum JW-YL-7 = DSM 7308]SHK52677.1 Undecaprenyl-diphosphatase [[Clostridium] paradoxum JW-YL-7 = DSM 7308]